MNTCGQCYDYFECYAEGVKAKSNATNRPCFRKETRDQPDPQVKKLIEEVAEALEKFTDDELMEG